MTTASRISHAGAAIAGVIGIIAVAALGLGIYAAGNGPLAIDTWWHDLLDLWPSDAALAVARAFEVIGGSVWMAIISVAVVVAFAIARRPWDALAVIVAMVVSEVITGTLKLTLARARPEDSLSSHALTSFPSGHTTLAATLAVVLALIIRRWFVWVIAIAWIVGMAWSRTYLDAHWFSDVVGGAVLGASVALIAWAAVDALHAAVDRRTRATVVRSEADADARSEADAVGRPDSD